MRADVTDGKKRLIVAEDPDEKIIDLQMSMQAGFAETSAIQKEMASAFDLRVSKIEQDKFEAHMFQVDGKCDGTATPSSLANQMQETITGLEKSLREVSQPPCIASFARSSSH
eukprot:6172339-Pyramimonas_sp.AAC.1